MKQKHQHRLRLSIGKGQDGKYHYKSFTGYGDTPAKARKEAEQLAKEWEVLHRDELQDSGMTFRKASDDYIASKDSVLSPATIRGYVNIAKNHLQGIMEMPVSEITQPVLQKEINAEARRCSPKTVRNICGFASAVMSAYRPDFKYTVTLPAKIHRNIHVPSSDEIEKTLGFIKQNDTELFKAVLLAALGSLRRSEIAALTLSDVHKDHVTVCKALVPNRNNVYVVKPTPKTDDSNRDVKMPPEVISQLTSADGEHIVCINPHNITQRFESALKAAEIPHFRFHDLRHYQASILHALGVPDKYIMARGGWKTDATLKRVYQHTMEEKRQQVEDEICNFFVDRFRNL